MRWGAAGARCRLLRRLGAAGGISSWHQRGSEERTRGVDAYNDEAYMEVCRKADAMIEQFRLDTKTHGVSVAVSARGRTVYKKAFGYQDIENGVPATVDLKATCAGISSLFAAHAWMKVMEMKPEWREKSLHDIIGTFPKELFVNSNCPDGKMHDKPHYLRKMENPIPAFAALCHSLNLHHYTSREQQLVYKAYNSSTQAYEDNKHKWLYFAQLPGHTYASPMGTGRPVVGHNYSSFGIDLVGVMLERLQPLAFGRLSKLLMLEMDMSDSLYFDEDEVTFGYSTGYSRAGSECIPGSGDMEIRQIESKYSHKLPSEGVVSTVTDLLRFGNIYAIMFKHRPREDSVKTAPRPPGPLEPATVREMFSLFSGEVESKYQSRGFGLGWRVSEELQREQPGKASKDEGAKLQLTASHGGYASGNSSHLRVLFCHQRERHLAVHHPKAAFAPRAAENHQQQQLPIEDSQHLPLELRANFGREVRARIRRRILEEPDRLWEAHSRRMRAAQRELEEKIEALRARAKLELDEAQEKFHEEVEAEMRPLAEEIRVREMEFDPHAGRTLADAVRMTEWQRCAVERRSLIHRQRVDTMERNLRLRERLAREGAERRTLEERDRIARELGGRVAALEREHAAWRGHVIGEEFGPRHREAVRRRRSEEDAIYWERRALEDLARRDAERQLREELGEEEVEARKRDDLKPVAFLEEDDVDEEEAHQTRLSYQMSSVGKTVVVATVANQGGVGVDELSRRIADLFALHFFDSLSDHDNKQPSV